jgi:hypothetical protein
MRKLALLLMFFGLLMIIPTLAQSEPEGCPAGQMKVEGVCGDPTILEPSGGWSKIEPGGETTCAHGDPYAFWYKPGTRNDALVYLQGGGGCWNADTCRATGEEFNGFYDSIVTGRDNPIHESGMLDFSSPENPFADYSVIYAPVCTGDVHWGQNTVTFEDAEEGDVTMHYNGFINTSAALDLLYEVLPEPDSVFITGCSAGSAGSIVHAPYVIEQYPDTRVVQLGDSLSLLFTGAVDLQEDWHAHDSFAPWIPALADLEPLEWTMANLYNATAAYYPDYIFSQFNTVRDEVQVFFTYPDGSGTADEWTKLLETHLDTILSASPNYRAFTAGGDLHCVTPRPDFYRYTIDGIRLVDWVAALAKGEDVPVLHCDDCDQPERQSR